MPGRIPVLPTSRKGLHVRVLFMWLWFAIGLFTVVLVIRSPFFRVKGIDIAGAMNLSKETVLAQSGVTLGEMVWDVRTDAVKQRLLQNLEIADVHLEWSQLGWLYIKVQEKPFVASLRTEEGFVPLTAGGQWLPHRMDKPAGPILSSACQEASSFSGEIARHLGKLPIFHLSRVVSIAVNCWPGAVTLTIPPHRVVVRLEDLASQVPRYFDNFLHHPAGTVYFLDAIWFSPDS